MSLILTDIASEGDKEPVFPKDMSRLCSRSRNDYRDLLAFLIFPLSLTRLAIARSWKMTAARSGRSSSIISHIIVP